MTYNSRKSIFEDLLHFLPHAIVVLIVADDLYKLISITNDKRNQGIFNDFKGRFSNYLCHSPMRSFSTQNRKCVFVLLNMLRGQKGLLFIKHNFSGVSE